MMCCSLGNRLVQPSSDREKGSPNSSCRQRSGASRRHKQLLPARLRTSRSSCTCASCSRRSRSSRAPTTRAESAPSGIRTVYSYSGSTIALSSVSRKVMDYTRTSVNVRVLLELVEIRHVRADSSAWRTCRRCSPARTPIARR